MFYEKGQRVKLKSPKLGYYTCIDIIKNPDIEIEFEHTVGVCEKCGGKYKLKKNWNLDTVYVFQDDEGNISYKGGQENRLIRMPDDTYFPEKKEEIESKVEAKNGSN